MNLNQAKSTLLVRCVELADRAGVLLPFAIRDRCTLRAEPPSPETGGSRATGWLTPAEQAFVARRAGLIEKQLGKRSPALVLHGTDRNLGGPMTVAVLTVVLVIGFLSPNVWSDEPLHLLRFPLLWLIGWNILVYLWLLIGPPLLGSVRRAAHPLSTLVASALARVLRSRLSPPSAAGDDKAALAAAAATRFVREWLPLQAPLALAQAKVLLHAAALCLAVGMAVGLLARAVVHEYLAGWETTFSFVDAGFLHALLGVLLAPASLLTGIPIPGVAQIEALRFHDGTGGGNAQDWIFLYVAAAFIYVIVPRAVLWWSGRRQAARLRREFYLPSAEDRYYRQLLQAGRGAGEVAAVIWHGIEPTAGLKVRVRDTLADELGGRVTLDFLEPIVYGEESSVPQRLAAQDPREHLIAVFSLAATPEEEVQGELLRQLTISDAAGEEVAPLVLLDAAPLERFATEGGYRAHFDERLRAWNSFIKSHHASCRVLEPVHEPPSRPGEAA